MNNSSSSMPLKRQLRYLQQCRDNWKQNASLKQKKLREYVQLTRSLQKSRDNWKTRAKTAEQRVKELEQQLAELSPSSSDSEQDNDNDDNDDSATIPNHHYPTSTISVTVQQFIKGGHSYRGIAQTMTLISPYSSLLTPHYSTVKSWVERIGLYELQRPKERRNDWLFIVDLTLELGTNQALVIYGISYQFWSQQVLPRQRGLKHNDGHIFCLEVTSHPTGEWIHSILESVSLQVGIPLQIIADHASNLKKGIQLFQARYPHVIFTYDVTHALANLLKKELFAPQVFQNFLTDCHLCRLRLQQTPLAFAAPPSQRSKCRFLNLDSLLYWANRLLYAKLDTFSPLLPHLDDFQDLFSLLYRQLSWVSSYHFSILIWSSQLYLIRSAQTQVKSFGFNSDSVSLLHSHFSQVEIFPFLLPFKDKLFHYLEQQVSLAPFPLLATSDVLESIFGRYKFFSQRCPIKELRSLLLTIPLTTINFTSSFIKEALSTVSVKHLLNWVNQTFGQSMLSKRRLLFDHPY